jgi:hypothetical protein
MFQQSMTIPEPVMLLKHLEQFKYLQHIHWKFSHLLEKCNVTPLHEAAHSSTFKSFSHIAMGFVVPTSLNGK